jgi:Phage head-tail joining protein
MKQAALLRFPERTFMLNARQLSHMRSEVARLLPDTCDIHAKSTVADGAGGWSEVWTVAATVACRVDPISARRALDTAAGQEFLYVMYQLTVPHDALLSVGNRIVTGGHTYELRQLIGEHTWRVSRRAMLVRLA